VSTKRGQAHGSYARSLLDFTEIPDGESFELLVRDMLVSMEYRVTWSGRGADQEKDLLVDEPGDKSFGMKPRRWLVSCKHNALANNKNGRSVNRLIEQELKKSYMQLVKSTYPVEERHATRAPPTYYACVEFCGR